QVIVGRETQTGRIIGFGSRSAMDRFVNGTSRRIGYLGNLHLLSSHRHVGLFVRGYAFFPLLHADGKAPLYLTTIMEDAKVSVDILTSDRAELPTYHFAGRYIAAAIPLVRQQPAETKEIEIRTGDEEDLPQVVAFLKAVGPHRQFFPCYET